MPDVEFGAANSRICRGGYSTLMHSWQETLTFQVKYQDSSRSNLASWGLWYPSNFCKGVICCMHHSHSGHEVRCAIYCMAAGMYFPLVWMHKGKILCRSTWLGWLILLEEEPVCVNLSLCVGYIKGKFYAISFYLSVMLWPGWGKPCQLSATGVGPVVYLVGVKFSLYVWVTFVTT